MIGAIRSGGAPSWRSRSCSALTAAAPVRPALALARFLSLQLGAAVRTAGTAVSFEVLAQHEALAPAIELLGKRARLVDQSRELLRRDITVLRANGRSCC